MVTLRSYLQDRSKAEFAKKLGVSPSYLSQLLSCHRKPNLAMMIKVQEVTDGEVDLNSWALMLAAAPVHDRPKRKGAA